MTRTLITCFSFLPVPTLLSKAVLQPQRRPRSFPAISIVIVSKGPSWTLFFVVPYEGADSLGPAFSHVRQQIFHDVNGPSPIYTPDKLRLPAVTLLGQTKFRLLPAKKSPRPLHYIPIHHVDLDRGQPVPGSLILKVFLQREAAFALQQPGKPKQISLGDPREFPVRWHLLWIHSMLGRLSFTRFTRLLSTEMGGSQSSWVPRHSAPWRHMTCEACEEPTLGDPLLRVTDHRLARCFSRHAGSSKGEP